MLARRLMGMGRVGSFPAPVQAQLDPVTLFAAPKGGGVTAPDPKAYHYNGRTFFGWVNGDHGSVELASYDHATQTVSASNAIGDPGGSGDPDDHDQAALIVRESDKRILAAFCRHVGSAMWIRVSLDPESIGGAWPALTNIDSQLGGTGYTYPSLVQLRGVANDPIYLFYRDTVAGPISRLCYSVSTDDGATWAAQTVMFSASTQFLSWRVGSDWDTRIDILVNDGDAYTAATSLYHFYMDGSDGSLHRSDGTTITAPIAPADATLVHDGDDGTGWPAGTTLHGGSPFVVYYVKLDASTNSLRRARWTGSAWDVREITTAGVHPLDRFSTGLSIVQDDPDTVYLGDLVSGTVEVFRYRTVDGETWSGQQITTSSPDHNAQVQTVHFGVSALPALWFQGPWTSQHDFDLATMGVRNG